MEAKDINLYVETGGGQSDAAQGDDGGDALADAAVALATAASALKRTSGGPAIRVAGRTGGTAAAKSIANLSVASKERIHSTLERALAAELGREGDTFGLNPGDLVAISSSVGQHITF